MLSIATMNCVRPLRSPIDTYNAMHELDTKTTESTKPVSSSQSGWRLLSNWGTRGGTKFQHQHEFSDRKIFSSFPLSTVVWTRYGLGTVIKHRDEDGITIVKIQGLCAMTLFINTKVEDCYIVPALCYDWVGTPAGEGLVISYQASVRKYDVLIDDIKHSIPYTHVKRVVPKRRVNVLPEESIVYMGISSAFNFVSNRYYTGQCVVTSYGSGHILSFDVACDCARIQLTWGAIAHLQTYSILHYVKACIGMNVATPFGNGVVTTIRASDAMYTIRIDDNNEEEKYVYVPESDVKRLTMSGVPIQRVKHTTTKLFSLAQSTIKMFGTSRVPRCSDNPHSELLVEPSTATI